jgi:hypothetical protein
MQPPVDTVEASLRHQSSSEQSKRQELEDKLEEYIQTLLELGITVYDYQPESLPVVMDKV